MQIFDIIVYYRHTAIRMKQGVSKNNVSFIVCFLMGNSPASEFYMPTFQNILSVPSS